MEELHRSTAWTNNSLILILASFLLLGKWIGGFRNPPVFVILGERKYALPDRNRPMAANKGSCAACLPFQGNLLLRKPDFLGPRSNLVKQQSVKTSPMPSTSLASIYTNAFMSVPYVMRLLTATCLNLWIGENNDNYYYTTRQTRGSPIKRPVSTTWHHLTVT